LAISGNFAENRRRKAPSAIIGKIW